MHGAGGKGGGGGGERGGKGEGGTVVVFLHLYSEYLSICVRVSQTDDPVGTL